jgi:hypothetical protein
VSIIKSKNKIKDEHFRQTALIKQTALPLKRKAQAILWNA